jgi:hypothetical protein
MKILPMTEQIRDHVQDNVKNPHIVKTIYRLYRKKLTRHHNNFVMVASLRIRKTRINFRKQCCGKQRSTPITPIVLEDPVDDQVTPSNIQSAPQRKTFLIPEVPLLTLWKEDTPKGAFGFIDANDQ